MDGILTIHSSIAILHSLAAGIGVGTVVVTDFIFFKFLKNFRITKNELGIMKGLSKIIWVALAVIIATGIYLVASRPAALSSPKFQLKMAVVAVIILNGSVLNFFVTPRLQKISFYEGTANAGSPQPDIVRKIAVACGMISIFSWLLAFLLGSIRKIPFSLSRGLAYYFGVLAIIALIASLTKRKRV